MNRSRLANIRSTMGLSLLAAGTSLASILATEPVHSAAISIRSTPVAISTQAQETPIHNPVYRVGVMAIRGVDKAEQQWQPTIDYLNQAIPGYQFELVPLEFDTMEAIINRQEIDFILPNPGMYVELEWVYGARRIATLENLRLGQPYTQFGAVIFRRAGRNDIQDLKDLKGKRFMAVNEIAFGGWQMAWATIQEAGVDPYQNFSRLEFGGSHDAVVYAVLEGRVDAGTVRTDTLERMEQEGKINRADFVVLNQQTQHGDHFPFALSTELYPEWPFAAFPNTPSDLSEKVAIALMTIPPEHPAAQAGRYEGWTIPANYQPIHETLRYLQVRPYENWGEVPLNEVLYQYRYWLIFTAIALGGLGYGGVQLATRQRIESGLRQANAALENRVEARTSELREAKEAAELASSSKSAFLSSMSHELRTPLNAILGFTQVMLRGLSLNKVNLPHALLLEQRETLGIIHRSGEHLLSLINDVLDMSKIEAGQVTLLETPFDLLAMLEALIEMLHLRADTKGVSLLYDCTDQVPHWIYGDERKLRQILINLVGNAIKFTEEGSVVLRVDAVACPSAPDTLSDDTSENLPRYTLTFEVEDTGVGIAPDEVDHLFEAFVQTRSGQRAREGTGLGLPISRQFIQLMGGDLSVNSTLGIGTCFQFSLPVKLAIVDQVSQPHQHRHVVGLAPGQPTYRILAVDDCWENRQLLLQFLQPLGFEVYQAENGQQAIEQWIEHQPHLIWMDIRMPVMNGYDATQTIKSRPEGKDTTIIALTASVFEDERANILQAGCDDFVRKPISEELLLRKLTQHLGVSYRYIDDRLTVPLEKPQRQIESNDLASLPSEWVAQLRLAARGADDDLIWQLLDQIPKSQSDLAEALAEMVNEFRLDKIIRLTESIPDTGANHPSLEPMPNQTRYQILVVDDRSDNRRLLCKLLQPLGFEVREADNGQQAIDLWQEFLPQLIFMDIRMPVMNGYDATRHIKAQPNGHNTTIIALTASVFEDERNNIFQAGFDDFMRKPFSERQLLQNLSQYLGIPYPYQETLASASLSKP